MGNNIYSKLNPIKTDIYDNGEWKMRTFKDLDDNIWCCLKDVGESIQSTNHKKLLNMIDDTERGVTQVYLPDTNNHVQQTTFISEPALYQVLNRSNLPIAKQFSKWVCYEVLPTIRKAGAYMTKETLAELEKNPRKMAELYNRLADMQEEHERKEKELMAANNELSMVIEQQNPVIQMVDAAISKGDALTVSEFAKLIYSKGYSNKGRNKMYELLRKENWLDKRNNPYQKTINEQLMTTKLRSAIVNYGKGDILEEYVEKYITVKGMKAISNILYKNIIRSNSIELF